MKKYIIIIFTLLAVSAYAQQDAQYTQYMFNGLMLNPAYAGNKGVLNVNGSYRDQWAGINGSPKTMTLTMDAPVFFNKIGLGLEIVNDNIGAQNMFSLFTSYAYRMKLSNEGTLSFGLSIGLSQYSFNGSAINLLENNDLAKPGQSASSLIPDAKTGAYYSTNNFYAGLSVTNLFAQQINNVNLPSDATSFTTLGRHAYFNTGYIISFAGPWKLYPSILIKEDFKAPTNIDFNALALYDNLIWFGGSYRTSVAWFNKNLVGNLPSTDVFAIIFALNLNNRMRLGYSYDISTSDLGHYDDGSHEITLSYIFPDKRNSRMLSPRYF